MNRLNAISWPVTRRPHEPHFHSSVQLSVVLVMRVIPLADRCRFLQWRTVNRLRRFQ
jgi:hypothetical protein